MDFFDINFSTYFSNKHGKEVFENITKLIQQERTDINDNNYIEIIFKIALLDFIGQKHYIIKKIIEDTMNYKIDIEQIMSIHRKSLIIIQKHLQTAMDEMLHK